MTEEPFHCRRTGVVDGVPVCGHGEPMYLFGGSWKCAVKVRARVNKRWREKYNNDPIFRISQNLRTCRQERHKRIVAAKERLARLREERLDGPLPEQRRNRPSVEPDQASDHVGARHPDPGLA